MNTRDMELLLEMTRVARPAEAVVIEVAEVHWLQPHTPFTVWHPLAVLPSDCSPIAVDTARQKLLQRKRFFSICGECGQRNAAGHMHSAKLCMSCAEGSHGAVY